ncbi:Methyl-CpG Hypothetical protein domain [Nesidiocoris tenuis]|uniref:MBD domain-containing protein n=1 Tax=Nesidiocoris tenuis TaxID=355587 RepID=A0ABN7A925_9HEMI|nr:Methyl-CpG Hypothetical protein domain [Nesidiocoris tenuis]
MDDPKLLAPFELGWVREVVYRNNKKSRADIYYRSPSNEKARTPNDLVSKNLLSGGLTVENFSFAGAPIGVNDPRKEVVRRATEQKQPRQSLKKERFVSERPKTQNVIEKQETPTKSLPADFRDFLAPFRFGWRRELVQRSSSIGNKQFDVYYRSPCGKKARSKIDIQRLIGPELSKDNFSFVPKPLGGGENEVYRYANLKKREPPTDDNCDYSCNGHCSFPPPIENDFQCPKSSPHYPLAPSDPLRLRMVPPASHVEAPHASSSPFSAPPVKEARIDTSQSSKTDAIRLGEADSNGFADEYVHGEMARSPRILERCKLATVIVQRCETELLSNRNCDAEKSPRQKLKTALRKTRSCVLHNCNEANNLDSGLTRGNTLLHRTLSLRFTTKILFDQKEICQRPMRDKLGVGPLSIRPQPGENSFHLIVEQKEFLPTRQNEKNWFSLDQKIVEVARERSDYLLTRSTKAVHHSNFNQMLNSP